MGPTRAAVDELEGAGCRAKRIKTESSARSSSTPGPQKTGTRAADQPIHKSSSVSHSTVDENNKGADITMLNIRKQHQPSKGNKGTNTSRAAKAKSSSSSTQTRPISGTEGISPALVQSTNDELDVSSSPSDPFELAIWVAQAVRRIHNRVQATLEADTRHSEMERRSSSRTPGLHINGTDNDAGVPEPVEREKERDEQRLRKQRWRSEHREENSDNDLRCRINTRAKALYGTNPSVEKTKFMETEFERRKARRNSKESRESESSGFTFGPEIVGNLFSAQGTDRPIDVNAAGILLMNALQGMRSKVYAKSNHEATTALKIALRDSNIGARPFVEALHILSADPGVMDAINLAMQGHDHGSSGESSIPTLANTATTSPTNADSRRSSKTGQDPPSYPHASGLRGGGANGYSIDNHYQSNDAIKALNAATLILSDIAEGSSSHYVTPYGNPPPTNTGMNSLTNTNGAQTKESIEPNIADQANAARPLTKYQIDALLEFANGGSVMDKDDDESVPDAPDNTTETLEAEMTPQPDIDINATLQRIIMELTADESGDRDKLGFPLATSHANKAATLQHLFAEAGISINTILPAAQAHATSQLYAHLSSRAHKFPTSGGINPIHASAYGNTAQMTQRMLARPVNGSQPPQSAPSTSAGNAVGPTARGTRGKSAEEIRKIREYGFPPLPGCRPGLK